MNDLTDLSKVVSVTPKMIEIEIFDTAKYRQMDPLKIGTYIEISDTPDGSHSLVAVIKGFRVKDSVPADSHVVNSDEISGIDGGDPQFIVGMQPVGRLDDGRFVRGANEISIPPKYIKIASEGILNAIYGTNNVESPLCFGCLAQDDSVAVNLNGNRFFGKHVGIVGSTGSGKSSTVAAILQQGIKQTEQQEKSGLKNNSHIMIFDLHGEYGSAFPGARVLSAENIVLPYWLMNSEELEELFVESNDQSSHNQISQFRSAVIENKRHHNPNVSDVSYDDPVYFSFQEVINYFKNLNREVTGETSEDRGRPKLADGTYVEERFPKYFSKVHEFVPTSKQKEDKANLGPFNGKFDRFIMRLESKTKDSRLKFLLDPRFEDKVEPKTGETERIIRQILGYEDKGVNVTIFDLSGVPFEVLSNFVSLVSRLVFTFCMNYRRAHREWNDSEELPYLLVLEEAHNYISRTEGAKYDVVRRSVERIAKEGRKYGLSLMIVSQRPAEISETIFSQCSNFVAMRLTNPVDQNFVQRLLPDDVSALTDSISSLGKREALIIGDSVSLPTHIKINAITNLPSSSDVQFLDEWRKDWDDNGFDGIIKKMIKET